MSKDIQWDSEMQTALRTLFYYNPDTGEIGRRFDTPRAPRGQLTSIGGTGDLQTNFLWKGKIYSLRANRLAYFLHTGEQPAFVQYMDYDKTNLKISNLRAVYSRAQTVAKHKPVASTDVLFHVRQTEPAAPMNVPQPEQQYQAPAPGKGLPNLDLFDELFARGIQKGTAKYTPYGTIISSLFGEALPRGFRYREQTPEVQAHIRKGWIALLYRTRPVNDVGQTQEDLDGTPRYKQTDCVITLAADITVEQALRDAGEWPYGEPVKQAESTWGNPDDFNHS